MKKNIIYAMLLALGVITLASCDKDTEGLSRITTYAVLEMNGESFMKVNVGGSFNDPGCVATMGGEDVTDQIQVNSNVDTSKPGFYNVNYVVYNDDGFPASASRTVMVVDPNNFAGVYLGESEFGSRHYYDAPINITKRADGTFLIDDLAGGFYCYGRYPGYEPTYDFHLEAILQLNADNTIEVLAQGSWYWGDPMEDVSGSYDPATGTIKLVMDFGAPFYVTLTK
ncbi:MAG: DUF5012 domain-containing protein [Prevotella sp.]|nr:DUF5012 domain-containing protein [Prevotella sp.]